MRQTDISFRLESEDVERKIDMVEEELSDASIKHNPAKLTELVEHFSDTVLHPNHYLLMLAKRNYICLVKKAQIEKIAAESVSQNGKTTHKNGFDKDHYEQSLCASFKHDLSVLKKIGWGNI